MLDSFLQIAYKHETAKTAAAELNTLMGGLPLGELAKLASGTPVAELYKTAGLCGDDGGPASFLDKFKGSPLFESAIALEEEELQAEMQQQQQQAARRAEYKGDDSLYDMKDKIRMKKRLLELQLAKSQSPTAAPPGEPAQGAGAPGDVPAAGVQDDSQGLGGGVAKVGFAEGLGREMAKNDFAKAAGALVGGSVALGHAMSKKEKTAEERAGQAMVMAKEAFGLGTIGAGLGRAAGWAVTHPGAAGAAAGGALGAAGGAAAGGPGHRLSGALGGAALGGAVGGMGAGTGVRMLSGQNLGQAAGNTLRSGANAVVKGTEAAAGRLPAAVRAPVQNGASLLQDKTHGLANRMAGLGGAAR